VREPVEIEGVDVVRVDPRLTLDWELRGVSAAVRRHRLDAFVTLSDRLPLIRTVPIVVWLFESPVHRIRANRRTRAPLWHRGSDLVTAAVWKRSLRRAAHVAFGSQATRDEILAELPLGSTSVVYPGVPPGFSAHEGERERFVLHLGSNDPRDNTGAAVEACRRSGARLVVVGGWRGAGAEARGLEGFCIPVLEAMHLGTPVLAQPVGGIPEVAGDAALLCDPRDVDALAEAVSRVLDERGLADRMRAAGLERASRFSWEATGAGLSAAIASVVP
jgi:glycosyltransferase involved in cell wall biosynthesis